MTELEKTYLLKIDEVISDGVYKDYWNSLRNYPVPKWFQSARLGIFSHWGVFSVPEYFNEWYPRLMYIRFNPVYYHHRNVYGKDFQYRQFIDMFRGEKFDPEEWAETIKNVGADYYVPVGEHHDGFKLYNSNLSKWNSVNMGVGRDVAGELKCECEKRNIVFGISNHRAEHCWFMNGMTTLNEASKAEIETYSDFYGAGIHRFKHNSILNSVDVLGGKFDNICPTDEWCASWLAHVCECVDLYRPSLMYFDWWIHNKKWRPYVKKFAAYYYNRSLEWGQEVTIAAKRDAMMFGTGVYDRERGQLQYIPNRKWECDTSTAYNAWIYCVKNRWKTPLDLANTFLDVVSKNGVLFLNLCPKADGSFSREEKELLEKFGRWNALHREIIWRSEPFRVFGEGKKVKGGTMKEKIKYTRNDYRFLYNDSHLFAFDMRPDNRPDYTIKTAGNGNSDEFGFNVKSVKLVDGTALSFAQTAKGLKIFGVKDIDVTMPLCFDIELD